MTGALLRTQAPGVSPNVKAAAFQTVTAGDSYCIQDSEDGDVTFYHYDGGATTATDAATITPGACTLATAT